ncbi:MAG: hypothetical protein RSB28_08075, partial [Oscillospiraceae bacterium]
GSMLSSKINYVNSAFLIFGVWLLIDQQKWVSQEILNGVTISVALVIFGVGLIYSEIKRKKTPSNQEVEVVQGTNFNRRATESTSQKPSFFAAFGLNQSRSSCKNLCGGDATAIFGGVELDLSDAVPSGNVTFSVNSIFGGVDIVPPKGYKIETTGVSLLGGCDNKLQDTQYDGSPIFTIKYFTFCGGIDIVNEIR